uniref:E3 ubiquitin-protein ligase TM129 n=2 Tax=Pyxicephalus adspersus TaxID=30357 RepID=A0AAV3AWG9_PYXAD|nr:TPA: hypothetical protein GDO54_009618 [Pyxicephalus adspersus]
MESPAVTFSLAYVVFTVCFVFTPNEFHSAGITVHNMLSRWLGTEDKAFVHFHIKRTTATVLVHSLIPLGYYLGMCIAAPEKQLYYIYTVSKGWKAFILMSVVLPTLAGLLTLYWSQNGWGNHPLARTLALHAPPQSTWRYVAACVSSEFKRVDKFATGVPGARVIATDTWVLKVTTYRVYAAKQQEVLLTVTQSRQHELTPDSNNTPVQFITIRVTSVIPNVPAFDIRINSAEYGELREKLRPPVRNVANVIIHRTLSDRFLDTFRSIVQTNHFYQMPSSQELELCIGCMQTRANIKIIKNCHEPALGECQQCFCRPMWCMNCMGKWFASRQDQQRPETWLSSRVPCPTCRATFCIVDVCVIR